MRDYVKELTDYFNEIEKLIETPIVVKGIVLDSIKNFGDADLSNTGKIKISNIKQAIENIEEGNLKSNFQIIYNQSCVLAVSSLAAVLERLFINYVQSNWNRIVISKKEKDLRVPLSYLLKYNLRLTTVIGKIILEKDTSVKLDDLQSLVRTFDEYFGVKIKIAA